MHHKTKSKRDLFLFLGMVSEQKGEMPKTGKSNAQR